MKKKEKMEPSKAIRCMNVEWKESYMMIVIGSLNQKKFCVTDTLMNTVKVLKGYAVFVVHQSQNVVVDTCRFI